MTSAPAPESSSGEFTITVFGFLLYFEILILIL
jgi:hypothetical protein